MFYIDLGSLMVMVIGRAIGINITNNITKIVTITLAPPVHIHRKCICNRLVPCRPPHLGLMRHQELYHLVPSRHLKSKRYVLRILTCRVDLLLLLLNPLLVKHSVFIFSIFYICFLWICNYICIMYIYLHNVKSKLRTAVAIFDVKMESNYKGIILNVL